MSKRPPVEAWAIFNNANSLCQGENTYEVYINRFEAELACLRWKFKNRTLTGYKVLRVFI